MIDVKDLRLSMWLAAYISQRLDHEAVKWWSYSHKCRV